MLKLVSRFIDLNTRELYKFTLVRRVIYSVNLCHSDICVNPEDLLGRIVQPSGETDLAMRVYVIYKNLKGDVTMGPVKNLDQINIIMQHPEIFQNPLDLRAIYDMISIL